MITKNESVAILEPAVDQSIEQQNEAIVHESPAIHEIARRAYEIYLERGSGPGQDREDWLQAERELNG
jgi:carbamate kinase